MNVATESVEITPRGIRKVLNKYTPQRAIAEYIWNGYDAHAKEVRVNTICENTFGSIIKVIVGDDGFKYRKGNPDIYRLLQQYGREELAKRFARQLRVLYTGTDYAMHKPCTMVDKLVEELEHPDCLLDKNLEL